MTINYNIIYSLLSVIIVPVLTERDLNLLSRNTRSSTLGNERNSSDYYSPSPYNLEDYCNSQEAEIRFDIEPWKGAIFQVGHKFGLQNIPESRKIHECKVTIRTKKDFWLVAAIENMKIRGKRDSSNKWKCSDYVKFTALRKNLVGKVLSVFNFEPFGAKRSEKLCGNKKLNGENLESIYDLSTDANTFSTNSNEMTFTFHQAKNERYSLNNSFTIVVTTFRHASEQVFAVECEGKQKCFGKDVYCIDKNFICDGHVNCAFPGSGTDEKLCRDEKQLSIFNMTSVIIMTLMGMVIFGIIVCIVSTIFCRVKSRLENGRRSPNQNQHFSSVPQSQQPTAPDFAPEATLPRYEAVILSDFSEDKNAPELGVNELPPRYETLFPSGVPSSPSIKESTDRNVER